MTTPPAVRVAAPALAGLAVAGIWMALAVWQPTTTWHLAPLLVVLAPRWTAASRDHAQRGLWLVTGIAMALITTGGLLAARLLRGPALIGPHPGIEALVAITAGAVVALAVLPSGDGSDSAS